MTYSFLHGGIEHILFNGLWLMAFGAPVLRRIGTVRFVLLWCISAAVSAFGHAALNWGDVTVLIGASGVVSALMGRPAASLSLRVADIAPPSVI